MASGKAYVNVFCDQSSDDLPIRLPVDDRSFGNATVGVKTVASVLPGATNLRIGIDGGLLPVTADDKIQLPSNWQQETFYIYAPSTKGITASPQPTEWFKLTHEREVALGRLASSLCYKTLDQECVTVVGKRYAVTYGHGKHANWLLGKVVAIYPLPENVDAPKGPIYVKVALPSDTQKDLVVLVSECDLCGEEPSISLCAQGEVYIQAGLSATTQFKSPFAINRGVITSAQVNKNGHILGSVGSAPGDSGGGIYNLMGQFLGMNVGADPGPKLTLDDTARNLMDKVSTRYATRAHIVPASTIQEIISTYEKQQPGQSAAGNTSGME